MKSVFGRASAPDRAGAHDVPPDLLVGGRRRVPLLILLILYPLDDLGISVRRRVKPLPFSHPTLTPGTPSRASAFWICACPGDGTS